MKMTIYEGGNWVWSSDNENAGNNLTSVMSYGEEDEDGWTDIEGLGKDADGDDWKLKGRMNKNGQVQLKSTYDDGKTTDFVGTRVGNQVKGFIKPSKSFTVSFHFERVKGKM